MVLGGRAFGGWLGHKGRALVNEMSALIKEVPQNSLVPSTTTWEHSEKIAVYEPKSRLSSDTESANALNLDFLASKTVGNKCWLSHPVYDIFDIVTRRN